MEHATEKARKKYLKEHPDADPKNHTVSKGKTKPTKTEKQHDKANKSLRQFSDGFKEFKGGDAEKKALSGMADAVDKALKGGDASKAQEAWDKMTDKWLPPKKSVPKEFYDLLWKLEGANHALQKGEKAKNKKSLKERFFGKKADDELRSGLMRLAHEKPELRKHIVPILRGKG